MSRKINLLFAIKNDHVFLYLIWLSGWKPEKVNSYKGKRVSDVSNNNNNNKVLDYFSCFIIIFSKIIITAYII